MDKKNKDLINNDKASESEELIKEKCDMIAKIACGLYVEVNPQNKVINLIPGILQFFTFDVVKSMGRVTIKPKIKDNTRIIKGNLAEYKIFANGILVNTYKNLNYLRNDILIFTATDESNNNEQEFAVVFGYSISNYSCRR